MRKLEIEGVIVEMKPHEELEGKWQVQVTDDGELREAYAGKEEKQAEGVFFGWVLQQMKDWAEQKGLTDKPQR